MHFLEELFEVEAHHLLGKYEGGAFPVEAELFFEVAQEVSEVDVEQMAILHKREGVAMASNGQTKIDQFKQSAASRQ
jgi:predicted RNase H-like nuclease